MSRLLLVMLMLALGSGAVLAQKVDPEMERLRTQLRSLDQDPALAGLAPAERLLARQAIDALAQARRGERDDRLWVAERRLDIARAAAEVERQKAALSELQRERDAILLEAAQHNAQHARQEAERLRLMNLAREEEAERAQREAEDARAQSELSSAEAEQARRVAEAQAREAALARREADLAAAAAASLRMQLDTMTPTRDGRGQVMTLAGEAFASGQSSLKSEARSNLHRVVEFLQSAPERGVLVEGHTDSQGGADLNQSLSQKRAEAVRDALVQEGVAAGRIQAIGQGMTQPIADNSTAAGRARNRRVEVVLLD